MPEAGGIAAGKLRAFVERVERLNEELKSLNDDKKDIFAEAKAQGFDTTALKTVIKIRAMDKETREEQEALVDLYLHALGMLPADARKAA